MIPVQQELSVTTFAAITINLRLTHYCNASCTYCASDRNMEKLVYIEPDNVLIAINFVLDEYQKMGVSLPSTVYIQYLGGEITLMPLQVITETVERVRGYFDERAINCIDGVQTNLLTNYTKLKALFQLFQGRLGTSIDRNTSQRSLSNSASRYQVIFNQNDDRFARESGYLPAVFVLDGLSSQYLQDEIRKANREARMLTIRPIYQGPGNIFRKKSTINEALIDGFHRWFLNCGIIVEPYYSLVLKTIAKRQQDAAPVKTVDGCHHCASCTERSICIEPDGSLYLCIEMADQGVFPLGNALLGTFDVTTYGELAHRYQMLHSDCYQCSYLDICEGGCMSDVVMDTGDIQGKSDKCEAWYQILGSIEKAIMLDISDVRSWLQKIEARTN